MDENDGGVLTGSNGRINKSEDISNLPGGKNHESTQAVTTFLIDDKDRLSESHRLSILIVALRSAPGWVYIPPDILVRYRL